MIAVGKRFTQLHPSKKEIRPIRPSKEEPIKVQGTVTEVLPQTWFHVTLANGHVVLARLGGRLAKYYIRITTGDRVELDISPYDLSKGRITRRL